MTTALALDQAVQVPSLAALREFVEQTLCDLDELVVGAFPIREQVLTRGDRVCGMSFRLSGPSTGAADRDLGRAAATDPVLRQPWP